MSTEKTRNLQLNIWAPAERLFLDEWNENFETIDREVENTKTQLAETATIAQVELKRDKATKITNSDLDISADVIPGIEKIDSRNIFNKNTVETSGYYTWESGIFNPSTEYYSSDFIPVKANQVYIRSMGLPYGVAYYNESKSYVGGYNGNWNDFTTTNDCAFLRITLDINVLNTIMVVEGNVLPIEYEPYTTATYKLNSNIITFDNVVIPDENPIVFDDFRANGKVPIFVETHYEGGNQLTHPKVIDLVTPVNGFRFWMAYTPYPYENDDYENPCIACSNDLIKWETPNGLSNPIDAPENYANISYLSDTHLQYVNGMFEVWYRGVKIDNSGEVIFRKTSPDGITWSVSEVLKETTSAVILKLLSPSFVYDVGSSKYRIWVADAVEGKIDYYESPTGTDWVLVTGIAITCWHLDVSYYEDIYEMVIIDVAGSNVTYFKSEDGVQWHSPTKLLLANRSHPYSLEYRLMYRPTLLKVNGYYYLYYGTIDRHNAWRITLSIAQHKNDISSLKGIDASFIPLMAKPTIKPKYANVGDSMYDATLDKPIWCKIGGGTTIAVWVDANGTVI